MEMRTFEQIDERLIEIRGLVETASSEDLDKLSVEKDALVEERKQIEADVEKRKNLLDSIKETKEFKSEEKQEERGNKMENKILTAESNEYREIFLKKLMGAHVSETEQRDYDAFTGGLQTGVAVVPTQTANMIFDSMTKIAPMLNEITLMRVAGGLRFAVQGARAAATVHVENAAMAGAADTLTTVTLAGFEFMKIIAISATMSTMAVSAFESWLTKILAEDLAVVIDNEIINSPNTTGGIVDGPAGGWVNGTNQITYVPANGLTFTDVTGLIALLPAVYDAGAKFVMRKSTFWTQFANMQDANGDPIVVKDLAAPGKYMILGYPILIDDNVAVNEAYLGDFKKVVGNLSSDIKVESSKEAGFATGNTLYRGLAIFDCDVADPAAIVKLNV
jgi:HK97 family phage major capsid protein